MKETNVIKQESLPPTDIGSKNVLSLDADTIANLGLYLQERYRKLKEFRETSGWEQEKADAFNSYHMVEKKRHLPFVGASNLSSPLPRIGVDSFHANVMASLFSESNRMKVVPMITHKDYARTADKAADYMNYVVNFEADTYMAVDDSDKKSQMYGVGYLEPVYIKEEIWDTVDVTETKTSVELDPATGEIVPRETIQTKREKKKKTVFDGIKINSIPVESIYVSPFFTSLEEAIRCDAVFKVFTKSFSDIKMRSKKEKGSDRPPFYISGQVKQLEPLVTNKIFQRLSELEQARARQDGFYLDVLSQNESVELAEGYLWYDIDNDDIKEELRVTFHPETGTVIRVCLSKCRIVDLNPRPVDGRFWGEGIPRIGRNLDTEWENIHNTRCNAGQWENTTFGFYRAGGMFNPQKITITPGHFYPVADPREVVFAQPPRVGSSYFQEEGLIMNYFERIFALNENMQGVPSRQGNTATESIQVANRSSIRFGNPFNRIVTSINKLLSHIWELNQECAPDEKEFFVTGNDGINLFSTMNKYDYSAKLKFQVQVSSVFDQQLKRDTWLLAYRLFLVNPYMQQHPELLWELSQKTLNQLAIDIDIPKPPTAKTLSPYEEHEMFKQGEYPEPEVGEDYDHHLKVHEEMLVSPSIKEWPPEAIKNLILHRDKTVILKQTLEMSNLNRSGMYTGNPMAPQPGMTSNRNPTQMFNTMKVGESGNSARKNLMDGNQGGSPNAEQSMGQVLGPI